MNDNVSANHQNHEHEKRFDLYQIGKWGAIAIIAYYLLTEHRAHVFQFLPYLIILACPLMHLFMHRGHGGHHHHSNEQKEQR